MLFAIVAADSVSRRQSSVVIALYFAVPVAEPSTTYSFPTNPRLTSALGSPELSLPESPFRVGRQEPRFITRLG